MRVRLFLLGTVASLALAACSATNTLDATDPILTTQGAVEPQRNLLLSDLSVGSPGNGRAIDEVFDMPVTSFRVAPAASGNQDPNGQGVLGLVRGSASRESFGAGNTLTYSAASNQFSFDVDTGAGQFSRVLNNFQFEDPVDSPGIENSGIAKLMFANPLFSFQSNFGAPINFQDVYDLGLGPNASIGQITAELTRLEESPVEADNLLFQSISDAATGYIQGGDQYFYGYSFVGGNGYVEVTNMNHTERNRETDTVAIISLKEFYDTGEEFHAHSVIGHRTPSPEMPTTGTATYAGKVVGDVLTNNSVRSLTGGSTVNVNFTTGLMDIVLSTQIRVGANNDGATTFIPYKDLIGSGVISDTLFDGRLTEPGGDSTGEFEGAFFGPVANEVGGTFTFGNESSYATGAYTGRQPDEE